MEGKLNIVKKSIISVVVILLFVTLTVIIFTYHNNYERYKNQEAEIYLPYYHGWQEPDTLIKIHSDGSSEIWEYGGGGMIVCKKSDGSGFYIDKEYEEDDEIRYKKIKLSLGQRKKVNELISNIKKNCKTVGERNYVEYSTAPALYTEIDGNMYSCFFEYEGNSHNELRILAYEMIRFSGMKEWSKLAGMNRKKVFSE